MMDINKTREAYGFPPLPPPDRYYVNGARVKSYREVKCVLRTKTLSGDFLRLEIAWRGVKRAIFNECKPLLKPILDYLK